MDTAEFVGAGDPEPAARPGGGSRSRIVGRLQQGENVPCVLQIGFARVCQANQPGGAGEEARAQAGLQRVDAAGGGRRAQTESAGGSGETAFLRDGDEDFKALDPVQNCLRLWSHSEIKSFE